MHMLCNIVIRFSNFYAFFYLCDTRLLHLFPYVGVTQKNNSFFICDPIQKTFWTSLFKLTLLYIRTSLSWGGFAQGAVQASSATALRPLDCATFDIPPRRQHHLDARWEWVTAPRCLHHLLLPELISSGPISLITCKYPCTLFGPAARRLDFPQGLSGGCFPAWISPSREVLPVCRQGLSLKGEMEIDPWISVIDMACWETWRAHLLCGKMTKSNR